jgi:hypothetical protein
VEAGKAAPQIRGSLSALLLPKPAKKGETVSTRAAIARKTNNGWVGVYHHSDGYPTGLGAFLWERLKSSYAGDIERFLRETVDAHPAGWSHIMDGHILTPVPSGHALRADPVGYGPACYCHTYAEAQYPENIIRGCECENPRVKEPSCDPLFIEWVYVFDPDARTMTVLASVWASEDRKAHTHVATVSVDGPEPDWEAFEKARYEPREQKTPAPSQAAPVPMSSAEYTRALEPEVGKASRLAQVRITVRSKRDPNRSYTVYISQGGKLFCSCPDFVYRRQKTGQECKHIREVRVQYGAEIDRMRAGLSPGEELSIPRILAIDIDI